MTHPSLRFETSEEQFEWNRLRECRDRGLISDQYHQKYLFETGRIERPPVAPRVAELRLRRVQRADASEEEVAVLLGLQPFRGCAQAKGFPEGQTPKTKRVKVSACTPQLGMKEARIKNGLSACIKHPNGHERTFFAIKQQSIRFSEALAAKS